MNENLLNLIWNLSYYDGRGPRAKLFSDDFFIQYSTNLICDFWFGSRSEGMKVIKEAEKAGYIRRDKIRLKGHGSKRGRSYLTHSLTPKGEQLRDILKQERGVI